MSKQDAGFLSVSVIWLGFLILSFTVGLYAGYAFGKNIGEASGLVRGIKQGVAAERVQVQMGQIHKIAPLVLPTEGTSSVSR